MTARVLIVDYGVGNLYSVQRALEYCGAHEIQISSNPADIEAAERLVLPGVGAFKDGMEGLAACGLVEPILRYAASGRPLLGICLGMQMLATQSEEFGNHSGLNLIPGRVVAIPAMREDGNTRKIPYIGWSKLTRADGTPPAPTVLDSIGGDDAVYLVHSYHVLPDNADDLIATYDFEGLAITAAIKRGNVTGLQFHPEKSGQVGLDIISAFLGAPQATGDPA